jgi:hypothetical protein
MKNFILRFIIKKKSIRAGSLKTTCGIILFVSQVWFCGCFDLDFEKIERRNNRLSKTLINVGLILLNPFYQPTDYKKKIGHIDTGVTQNFPLLADVTSKNPGYGLSMWHSDWIQPDFVANINQVGWNKFYVSGGYHEMIDDEEMANMVALAEAKNAVITYCLMGYARDEINPATGLPRFSTDEEFIQSYLDFVDVVVGRYGPGGTYFDDHPLPYRPILVWEVWDEPSYLYRQPASWVDPVLSSFDHQALVLAKLLYATYNHLHNNPAHPEWHAGGIKMKGVSPVRDPQILEMVHDHADSLYGTNTVLYDIVSVHPYIFDGPPDAEYVISEWQQFGFVNYFADIRSIMAAHGNGDKLVEATMGWHRNIGRFPATSSHYPIPELLQAAYVTRAYMIAMRCGLDSFHVFHIIDADRYNGGFFGIAMGSDGYWRVSKWWAETTATANMIRLMPRPRIMEAISDGVNGYYAYKIHPDPDMNPAAPPVIMAWNVVKPLYITLTCNPGDTFTVYNMLGYTEGPKTARSSSIALKVGPYPIYVIIE